MTRHCKLYLLALGFLLGATSAVLGQGHTFTAIDFPGSTSTIPWGINGSGDIAGLYTTADKATHGFLKSRGQFVSVDFPGAAYTDALGISPRGDVIGDYAATLTGSGPHHGYVLSREGVFTTIDYPAATSTFARGMNSRGDILGSYTSADNVSHNYVMSANPFSAIGQFITLDEVPGSTAASTGILGINGGDIVGSYTGADKVGHGFLLSDGQFTTIDSPGGATLTIVTGINSRGEMVGRFTVNGIVHAFLLSGGQFSAFDYPGATFTGSTAISPNGDILGRYTGADNVFHGFLLVGFRLSCVSSGS
jgi:hypothetical protein